MKSKSHFLLAIILLFGVSSCKNTNATEYRETSESVENPITNVVDHPGKELLETKCYVCHSPSNKHKGRLAPPMIAVKSHYFTDEISKQEFASAVWNFVQEPSEKKVKMWGAVRNFGLMPYQQFSEKEVRLIAEYMYDYEIEESE